MKLYNIFSEIILEAVGKPRIAKAIDNHQVITIYYKGDDTINAGFRDIEVYTLGISKAGNPVIRAWQRRGVTDTEVPGWKIFRTDKITSWIPKEGKFFSKPISSRKKGVPKFNPNGDKTMAKVDKIATFKKKI